MRMHHLITNFDHWIHITQPADLGTTPSPVVDENHSRGEFCAYMCMSNLLYDVIKYESSHWSGSPSDGTQTRFGEIRCDQGFIMGPMLIGLWQLIHVLFI